MLQWQRGMARHVLLNQQVSIVLSGTHGGPGLLSSAINITNIELRDSAVDYVDYRIIFIYTCNCKVIQNTTCIIFMIVFLRTSNQDVCN